MSVSRRHRRATWIVASCIILLAVVATGVVLYVSRNQGAPTTSATAEFPGPTNTGVPAGTVLAVYKGPCAITAANTTITAMSVGCDLVIQAPGVKITNSRIGGRVVSSEKDSSVTITDSTVDGGPQETFPSVSYQNLTLLRVNVIGGQHSVQCWSNCLIQDSWLHDQYIGPGSTGHVNAFISNGGSGFKLIHNTVFCSVQPTTAGGGCTADASLFGDFGPIADATFERNLFKANSSGAGYCVQAGYNPGKAYPNPTGVVFTDNVFEHGTNKLCGKWGPVTAFASSASGAKWSGNTWDDGTPLSP